MRKLEAQSGNATQSRTHSSRDGDLKLDLFDTKAFLSESENLCDKLRTKHYKVAELPSEALMSKRLAEGVRRGGLKKKKENTVVEIFPIH